MTVVAGAASTGLALEVNMDINAATGTVSDGETCVDTVENVACIHGGRQDSDRHNTRRSSFFSQGRPEGECTANKTVKFVNLNVECINSKKYDTSFLTPLANFDFTYLTETFADSIDLSLTELKDVMRFVAPAKQLSKRGRHS